MKDTGWTPMTGDFESPGVTDPELITGYGVDPKPAGDTEPVAPAGALREARMGLQCLYLEVPEVIARDVAARCEAAFAALATPAPDEGEDWAVELLQAIGRHFNIPTGSDLRRDLLPAIRGATPVQPARAAPGAAEPAQLQIRMKGQRGRRDWINCPSPKEYADAMASGVYDGRALYATPVTGDVQPEPAGDGVLPGDIAAYANFIEQAEYRRRQPSRWEIWMAALDYEREAPTGRATPAGDVQALADAVLQALPTNNVGSGVVMFPRLEKACLALRAALKGE